jgi:hypothetical protein
VSWPAFWLGSFLVAVATFVLISIAIAVRGIAEIRELFAALEEERRRKPS